MSKLEWLRGQAEAYWRDAETAPTDELRLVRLAVRCLEQILELQCGSPEKSTLH
jgi:hypothetical protein